MQNRYEPEYGNIVSIATRHVVTAPPTMRIFGAIETLTQWGIRRLPIVDPGTHRLKGIITARDVVDFFGGGEMFNLINVKHDGNFLAAINERVSKIMETDVRTLTLHSDISDAINIIVQNRFARYPYS